MDPMQEDPGLDQEQTTETATEDQSLQNDVDEQVEDQDAEPTITEDAQEAQDAGESLDSQESQDSQESEDQDREPGAWYVIHSYSGYENKVKQNLEQRIESMDMQNKIYPPEGVSDAVIVPTEEEVEIREGKRRTHSKRVFPGYILVHMVLDEESWYVVRNTPGVTGFVGSGTRPMPLSQEEVDKILTRMKADQPRIRVDFRVGETVRIIEGPFADFMAMVDEIYPERGKIRVLVSFFGRETPVEMDFMQVEKI
jgi:transcription termination/antitermination protein NusG